MGCHACGFGARPEYRFCPACGAALGPISGPVAERRLVSVLFVDLVGFTTLTEKLDAEDVRDLLSRYFETARECVARHGGVVEKFIGDAVMAAWGTPVAHEDDAERAVRAGLELLRAVGSLGREAGHELAARGGIATGEAAVTIGAEAQGMVAGDLVNVAARLQTAADAGSLLVDAATRRMTADVIEFAGGHSRALRGRSSPVSAWRALAPLATDGASRAGHPGPFVGRQETLALLETALGDVVADGRLRFVSVTGVAGIGKSRLAWELERLAIGRPETYAWHLGRAPAYGDGVAFAPISEMVRRRIDAPERQAPTATLRQLRRTLRTVAPQADERSWLETSLAGLVGLDKYTETDRSQTLAAWRCFFERVSDRWPAVLVFDDLQWADDALLDFVAEMVETSRAYPILIVTLARPELLTRRPDWGTQGRHSSAIQLDRLSEEAMQALLDGLAPELPRRTARRIRQQADGVPLYAIEMVRMLSDTEQLSVAPEAVALPDSLHALIAARIDALPTDERDLLMTGAVLGRRFHPDVLASVSGLGGTALRAHLRSLERRELLATDRQPRSPGRGQVAFVQELVREVAYRTLSRSLRRAHHLAAAAYLQSIGEPETAETVGDHLLAAYRLTPVRHPEHEALKGETRKAQERSAARAMALHAPGRALTHLEHALELAESEEERLHLAEQAARAARAAARFDDAEGYLRTIIAGRRERGERSAAARAAARLASLRLISRSNAEVLAELEAAWGEMLDLDDDGAIGELAGQLARAHLVRGDFASAITWADRVLSASSPEGADALDALVTRATAAASSGRSQEALADLERVLATAGSASQLHVELRARNNLAVLRLPDDPQASLAAARRAIELAHRAGHREMLLQLTDFATAAAIDCGEWEWIDTALADAEDEDPASVPQPYRLSFAITRTVLRAMRGSSGLPHPLAELTPADSSIDPHVLAALAYANAWEQLVDGRLEDSRRTALAAAADAVPIEREWAIMLAARAAVWLGDSAGASHLLDTLEPVTLQHRALDAAERALRASCLGLRGHLAEAREKYDQAADLQQSLGLPLPRGLALLDRYLVLDDASAAAAAEVIFDGLGARGLRERLSAPPLLHA